MGLDISPDCKGDEWALYITKALGFTEYVNAPGGMEFYERDKYRNHGITLQFIQPQLTPYEQKIGRFEPGLSIIDVMMFNSVDAIQKMLGEYTLA
jgi:hypothetical protein